MTGKTTVATPRIQHAARCFWSESAWHLTIDSVLFRLRFGFFNVSYRLVRAGSGVLVSHNRQLGWLARRLARRAFPQQGSQARSAPMAASADPSTPPRYVRAGSARRVT